MDNILARIGGRNTLIYGLIAVLLIVGLLLPPVSLFERVGLSCSGVTLDTNTPATSTDDGLTVALSDPAQSLKLKLQSVAQTKFEAGEAGDDLAAARSALPVNLVLHSPIYQINPCSAAPTSASLAVKIPDNAGAIDTLELYAWNGTAWTWLGAYLDANSRTVSAQVMSMPKNVALFQTASAAPFIGAQAKPDQSVPAETASLLNELYVPGWSISDGGTLLAQAGTLPVVSNARVFPIVRNWADDGSVNTDLVHAMLSADDVQQAHIAALTELAGRSNFAGVAISYRGLTTDDKTTFTKFIQKLAISVQVQNKLLAVVLPAPTIDANGAPDTAGYDWQAIGLSADIVQSDFGQDPSSYLSDGVAFALLNWAPTQVSRNKFQPILSVSSLDTLNNAVNEISYVEATKPLGQLKSTAPITVTGGASITLALDNPAQVSDYRFDAATQIYRFKYTDAGAVHTVVVNTAASLAQRLNLLLPRHLRGVVISSLPQEGVPADFVGVLTGYRQQSVSANEPPGIEVAWLVASPNGKQVLKTTRPVTDTTIMFTAPADAGSYNVVASIGPANLGSTLLNVASSVTAGGVTTTTTTPGSTAVLTATAGTTTTAAAGQACYNADFVADVTVPDGTKFKNSETFTKTWRLRNTGTCNWADDTVLVFNQGTKLGTPDTVKVGTVPTGTQVDVSVQLTAPDQYGKYTGIWQLKNAQGNFGTLMSAVIQAGDPPPGTVAAGAPGPVPPPITGGGFEIGGQVNCYPSNPSLMKHAGMVWVKIQVGKGCGVPIADMHSLGFKVLLSAVGADHSQVNNDAFQTQFASQLAGYASQGADAIEVWNEMNIDAEWPAGTIDAGSYVRMLQKAYQAIKAANPNTLVISGALAPTGFFGGGSGCGSAGCDDAAYVAAMFQAGAANFMDCLGVHYNEGVLGPDQTSGDPRGNSGFYSRYFWGMVNTYWNASGGSRKLCFTELGYLSPEGMNGGPLGPGFGWAQNTTVAEQAQWLAQAASLAASSGKVRMMIVWNVDFKDYNPNGDPKGGYAIIRPNGGCPACDSLGAVMPH